MSLRFLFLTFTVFSQNIFADPAYDSGDFYHRGASEGFLINACRDHESYCFDFMKMTESLGLKLNYYTIDDVLDRRLDSVSMQRGMISFFLLNDELVNSLGNSEIATRFLETVELFCGASDTVNVFFLPHVKAEDQMEHLYPLLDAAKISMGSNENNYSQTFMDNLKAWLKLPLCKRLRGFATTLSEPREQKFLELEREENDRRTVTCGLPFSRNGVEKPLQNMWPLGVYFYNLNKFNHIIFSDTLIPSFAGPTERFQIFPVLESLQNNIRSEIYRLLQEVKIMATSNSTLSQGLPENKIREHDFKKAPSLQKFYNTTEPATKVERLAGFSHLQKIGWFSLDVFFDREKKEKKEAHRQKKQKELLVKYTLESELDALWLNISPNVFYSRIAIKNFHRDIMAAGVKEFCQMMSSGAKKYKKKLPQLLIGFEIANNLNADNLPPDPAVDIFGTVYPDMPRPLDTDFWQEEIINSLELFLADVKNPDVLLDLKIAGVVLDLEMYLREKTPLFTSTMGFSQTTREVLRSDLKDLSLAKFVEKLGEGKTKKYFLKLEDEAFKLGQSLKMKIKKMLPSATVGIYMPEVHLSWFYKGFLRAMGTAKDKFLLFSFGTNFRFYKKVLESLGIFSHHYEVLMMSKFKNKNDFGKIDQGLKNNSTKTLDGNFGGVWLNRFSRIAQAHQTKQWFTVEQTPMKNKQKKAFLKYLAKA